MTDTAAADLVRAESLATQALAAAPRSSLAHYALTPTATGTLLVLDHSGFPPEDVAARHLGWRRVYFDPLRTYLES
jgi:hypothetical protein